MDGAAQPTEPASGAPLGHEAPSLEAVREAFPQLEVLELIGVGGMGVVYKARQPKLDRWVALKLLAEPLGKNPAFTERFHREARLLAKLNHPNIVAVHDFGEAGGFYYLTMEYVDGANLRQALEGGRFSPSQALAIVPRICEALQFAHDHGILHRDIKPENILLDTKGRVKIADFGIAKLVGSGKPETRLTVSGAALGTPAYMAPEQFERPTEVDHRADIYSLGVVFYEMLTGELPLGRFAAPSQKTALDQRVDEIVLRALSRERELRQQSAGEVKTQVENVTSASPSAVGAGAGKTAAIPAEDDFILCNPRLPRMAQAITVYGLLAAPFLWVLGFTVMDFGELAGHPGAAVLQTGWHLVGEVLGGLLRSVILVVGALKLRALRRSGITWIRVGVVLGILQFVVGTLVLVWAETLDPGGEAAVERLSLADGLVTGVSVLAMGFEVAILVWFHRNREWRLRLRGPAGYEDRAGVPPRPVAAAQPARTSKLALLSALLATPLWLRSMVLVGASLLSLVSRDAALVVSQTSASRIGLMVSFGGIFSIAGLVLGLAALGRIRRSQGRLQGAGLALAGVLGLPFGLSVTLAPALILSLGGSGLFPVLVGRRFYETAPLWLGGVLLLAAVGLRRWVEGGRSGRAGLLLGGGALGLLFLLPLVSLSLGPVLVDRAREQAQAADLVRPLSPRLSVSVFLGVSAGDGVMIDLVTSTREGIQAVLGSAGYYLASALRDGNVVYGWSPRSQLVLKGDRGAVLASATNVVLTAEVARSLPEGTYTMDCGWLESESESVRWLVERSGEGRPGLGVRLRTFAHGLGTVELSEMGFAGIGTNWAAEFPPALRTPPPVFRYTEIVPDARQATNRASARFVIPEGLDATFEVWSTDVESAQWSPREFKVEAVADRARVVQLEWSLGSGARDPAGGEPAWEVILRDGTSGEVLHRIGGDGVEPRRWELLGVDAARVKEGDGHELSLLATISSDESPAPVRAVKLYYGAEPSDRP